MESYFHLIVYVPVSHASDVRNALADAGAGQIGNYDSCSFSVQGTGRFRPNKNAKPTVGKPGVLESVDEERIEVVVDEEKLKHVLDAVITAHPYEEPAIHVIRMIDYKTLI